ncbi:MAG: diaminopimelate epimerase [Phycisphaerae bacterium]|jgi:diaminopimelate epimerase
MRFTKVHGLGNDYVLIDTREERVADPSLLARTVSDRHTGIGSDGLILFHPSSTADVRMEMYNADGSRAQMCGNGLRCVAKYAIEHGPLPEPRASARADVQHAAAPLRDGVRPAADGLIRSVAVETDAGVRACECQIVDGKVQAVRVDMGEPSLAASDLPSTIALDRIVDHALQIAGDEYVITCVSMGNPHAVVFVHDLDAVDLAVVGPRFEHAPEFPARINAHFARVDTPNHVTMRTWERGSGITRACGSGACAVCVAGAVTGRTRRAITVTLPGGDLSIERAGNDHVYMTGPAVEVFTGDWPQRIR